MYNSLQFSINDEVFLIYGDRNRLESGRENRLKSGRKMEKGVGG
jgi:hypothetical protein